MDMDGNFANYHFRRLSLDTARKTEYCRAGRENWRAFLPYLILLMFVPLITITGKPHFEASAIN